MAPGNERCPGVFDAPGHVPQHHHHQKDSLMPATKRRTKKLLSPEQLQEKDARKATIRKLCTLLGKMSDTERHAVAARLPGLLTCEGKTLSLVNQCLLALQCPTVTIVGGFQQWLRQGRCVTKGEHGLAIWIPLGTRDTDTGRIDMDEDDRRFMLATVFDIAQTHSTEDTTHSS